MSLATAQTLGESRPVLFARQRQLLLLLEALGGSAGGLDFQKLLFLYCQEQDSDSPYEFVPYKYGAFSFTSYSDRRKLIDRGLLADDDNSWELTTEGRQAIHGTQNLWMAVFAKRYRELRGDALVAESYRRFPFYATRSEIAERVLQGEPDVLARIHSARPIPGPSALSTIGYEGQTIESFLKKLLHASVTVLCDVRRNPISRKYGFSKSTLAKGCDGVGINYKHLPELGIASEQRQSLETQSDYDALFVEYELNILPRQTAALETIAEFVLSGEHVALTCYEVLPQQCHRHCVAEALEDRLGKDLVSQHL